MKKPTYDYSNVESLNDYIGAPANPVVQSVGLPTRYVVERTTYPGPYMAMGPVSMHATCLWD